MVVEVGFGYSENFDFLPFQDTILPLEDWKVD